MKKLAMAMMILTTLTACDKVSRRIDRSLEISDRTYQSAMNDYSAGRLEKAAVGFEKVLQSNPTHSAARFQLACLEQDKFKDYLAAICNYTEYLMQCPQTDKAILAKERLELCKKLLAKELAQDAQLGDASDLIDENNKLKAASAKSAAEIGELEKEVESLKSRLETITKENTNLRKMVSKIGETDEDAKPLTLPDDKSLLEDDNEPEMDRVKFSADVKNLIADEKKETVVAPFKVSEKKEKKESSKVDEPPHEARPEKYVIQEGDTLYKLAIRFYGVRSAWVKIRDANKAIISNDGRVKTGQTISLPE